MTKKSLFTSCFIILNLLNTSVWADGQANLKINLTITAAPKCTIQNASSMNVSFGNMYQADVNSDTYLKKIDYQLSCTELDKNALKMALQWSNLTINSQPSVQTNKTNLGIAIYQDSTILSSGQTLSFDINNPPNLYAKPVKPLNTTLSDLGQFTGTMTMVISYQ